MSQKQPKENYVDISLGRYEFFFQKRYTVLNTVNDFLIGLEFLIGSFFFFSEPLKDAGIWLFVIGSFQLIIRPTIRLVHDFHLKKHVEKQKKKEDS
ncbi:YrhK family protein [Salibacterium lacus]|uniref:YrhK family protein n=1 Tax=Salibacterium lacus TaxID=1898109 RepID=A0ABW5T1W7_9BACI